MNRFIIKNGQVITPEKVLENTTLVVESGKIKQIGGKITPSAADRIIDATNKLVVPGFIDLHIQGAGGADILDATPEAVRTIAKTCARFGVTGFLATTKCFPHADNRHLTIATELVGNNLDGAELLGIHIEGPFISPSRLGMIQIDNVSSPSMDFLREITELCREKLRMMTIAPEIEGNRELIENLVKMDIIPSFGHSDASYDETIKGFEYGIRHVTHLYNAMRSIHHRDPGPVPAVFDTDNVIAQIICDGAHIHPSVIRFTLQELGEQRFVLITDGMNAMGLPDGTYRYDALEFSSLNGIARYHDGRLVGTATSMNILIKRCIEFTNFSLSTVINAASLIPARVLGIDKRKGSLEIGKDADIVILNKDFSVWKTVIAGTVVYE